MPAAIGAALVLGGIALSAGAATLAGQVTFANRPVPGAVVTVQRAPVSEIRTVSGEDGRFVFTGLDDGSWTLQVAMRGFATATRVITVPGEGTPLVVALEMLPLTGISTAAGGHAGTEPPSRQDAPANGPLVIAGSTLNGAASPFAQSPAFGNARPRGRPLYTGNVSTGLGNSSWNGRPFAFGAPSVPAPRWHSEALSVTVGGPLRIPWLVSRGPSITLSYQRSTNSQVTTGRALMPTAAQRQGDFSRLAIELRDPETGAPFPDNLIPRDRISSQAAALLAWYPTTSGGDPYQLGLLSRSVGNALQVGSTKAFSNGQSIGGRFSVQRFMTTATSLFAFETSRDQVALDGSLTWSRRLGPRAQLRLTYQAIRTGSADTPHFANRANVSAEAGIAGNNQRPQNWGPPTIRFPSIASLGDADARDASRWIHGGSAEWRIRSGRHDLTAGAGLRRHAIRETLLVNGRGTLTFTGAATGDAFADFLLGLPTTSTLTFGQVPAELRGLDGEAYIADDWHPTAGLTINAGLRWEYEQPFTETSGRLANLEVSPGFAAARPVLAASGTRASAGSRYRASLLRSDNKFVEPRVAASWRPRLGSTLVLTASYGLYRNLGSYPSLALLLALQPPFARGVSVQSTPVRALALAQPFPDDSIGPPGSVAIDPNLRSARMHHWSVSAQRDTVGSLRLTAAYLGNRGTHLLQAIAPNTSPAGSINACQACPSGFVYLMSTGKAQRHALQLGVRRRLRGGLMAAFQWTLAHAMDDAASFGAAGPAVSSLAIAQDWRAPAAEYGPSPFDQRHSGTVEVQYSTGQSPATGHEGWWRALFVDWTFMGQLRAGSGLPVTPLLFTAITGSAFVGIRPQLTGASTRPVAPATWANAAAYTTPAAGIWGDAGRNSIRGPGQVSVDLTVSRPFRLTERTSLEWQVIATNVFNHVSFATIDAVVTSPRFGQPMLANPMRTVRLAARLRF